MSLMANNQTKKSMKKNIISCTCPPDVLSILCTIQNANPSP